MSAKFVGKFRKFRSSGSPGGERSRRISAPKPTRTPVDVAKDDIVSRLRMRAEKFESKANGLRLTDARTPMFIADELRKCATSIRLDEWSDADEI